jgi:hypothetical protein
MEAQDNWRKKWNVHPVRAVTRQNDYVYRDFVLPHKQLPCWTKRMSTMANEPLNPITEWRQRVELTQREIQSAEAVSNLRSWYSDHNLRYQAAATFTFGFRRPYFL